MALGLFIPLALAAASSASVLPREPTNAGFLSLPIQHTQRIRSFSEIAKRDADVTLYNVSALSYLIELSIGTPGQSVKVAIDTGSDELWVDPNCSDVQLTTTQESECNADGKYITSKSSTSSTSNVTGTSNDIRYGKGEVIIDYVTDTIALPGSSASVKDVQFGVARDSTELNEGILGIGWGINKNLNYSNFIDQLADQGVTNSKAFSVALGSVDASNGGVIIFGGIDTKKFSGSLITNTILAPQSKNDINRYWVQLSSITKSGSSTPYSGGNVPIVLDTGSSLSYLPSTVMSAMVKDFSLTYVASAGVYLVPCSQRTQGGTIDFAFGSGTIKVPISDFIWQATSSECVFGALPADTSSGVTALLGDTFMRSVYAVFDQTMNTISLASYSNCGQAEQSIPAGGVTNITGQCTGTKNAAGRSTYSAVGLAVSMFAVVVMSL